MMPVESLQQIIALENELHAREQEEKARVEQWLKGEETALRAEFGQRRDALTLETEAARQQARAKAERRAAEIINAAEQRARQLSAVSDEVLRQLLERYLIAMVTGRLP